MSVCGRVGMLSAGSIAKLPPLGMSCGHPYPMTGPSGGPARPGHMVDSRTPCRARVAQRPMEPASGVSEPARWLDSNSTQLFPAPPAPTES